MGGLSPGNRLPSTDCAKRTAHVATCKFQTGFQAGAEKSGCIPKVLSAISAKVVSAKSNTGMMYVSFANSFSYIIKTSEN